MMQVLFLLRDVYLRMSADDSAIMHLCSAKSVLYPAVMPLRSAIMAIHSAKTAYSSAIAVIGSILIQRTSFPNPRQTKFLTQVSVHTIVRVK